MQVAVTRDYSTDSWFFSVITGAMNFQTAHHLFPGRMENRLAISNTIAALPYIHTCTFTLDPIGS